MSGLEIVAVALSLLNVWLTARRHILCWPAGLVAVGLYGKLFFDAKLYADTMLQAVFTVATLYGWFVWLRRTDRGGEVRIAELAPHEMWRDLGLGAIGGAALGFVMARYTDASLPWLDSALTAFSMVAQIWTARCYVANWRLWIAIDTTYTGMFVFKGLDLTAALYAAFVVLAGIGLSSWTKTRRRQSQAAPEAAASALPTVR